MVGTILYAIGGIIEALIGLRIVLRLLGANPASGFVNMVYDWSTPFVTPFSGIFGQDATVVSNTGVVTQSVFDWTAVIALIMIALIVAVLGRLFVHPRGAAA
ncbi:MAG TPA: YggT family protein [Verrucomicrobiae bacterium]|nr:YggT family protein [Verrucomicrobiae bacterium]